MENKAASTNKSQKVALVHIIRIALKPGVASEKFEAAIAQLHKMGNEIESVRSYCVGKDVGGEFHYSAVFTFDDLAGYAEYMHSPIHRKLDEIGLPLVDNMVSFDVAGVADEAIAEKITEMHRSRYAGDKELANLVGGLKSYSGSGFGQ